MVHKQDLKYSTHTHLKTPSKEVGPLSDLEGGIGIVEMLYRCNILAIVGGGVHPKFPTNKVMLWDDHQLKCIGELSFKSDVLSVRLRRDKIVVVLESKIYLYNFSDLKLIDAWETLIPNSQGHCVLASAGDAILAYPDSKLGNFIIRNCGICIN